MYTTSYSWEQIVAILTRRFAHLQSLTREGEFTDLSLRQISFLETIHQLDNPTPTELAKELHLDVLMEVHDEAELQMVLETGCELIGINNRNLQTFETDLATTERLLPWIPAEYFVVAESGIACRADVERLQRAGARGFLVGESLMREDDIGAKLRELQGQTD